MLPLYFCAACCGINHDTPRTVLYVCEKKEEKESTSSLIDDNEDGDDDANGVHNGEKGEDAGEEDLEAVASLLASRLHLGDGCWAAGLRDRCVVFWSSGTTGRPKGIPKTHQQLLSGLFLLYFFLLKE